MFGGFSKPTYLAVGDPYRPRVTVTREGGRGTLIRRLRRRYEKLEKEAKAAEKEWSSMEPGSMSRREKLRLKARTQDARLAADEARQKLDEEVDKKAFNSCGSSKNRKGTFTEFKSLFNGEKYTDKHHHRRIAAREGRQKRLEGAFVGTVAAKTMVVGGGGGDMGLFNNHPEWVADPYQQWKPFERSSTFKPSLQPENGDSDDSYLDFDSEEDEDESDEETSSSAKRRAKRLKAKEAAKRKAEQKKEKERLANGGKPKIDWARQHVRPVCVGPCKTGPENAGGGGFGKFPEYILDDTEQTRFNIAEDEREAHIEACRGRKPFTAALKKIDLFDADNKDYSFAEDEKHKRKLRRRERKLASMTRKERAEFLLKEKKKGMLKLHGARDFRPPSSSSTCRPGSVGRGFTKFPEWVSEPLFDPREERKRKEKEEKDRLAKAAADGDLADDDSVILPNIPFKPLKHDRPFSPAPHGKWHIAGPHRSAKEQQDVFRSWWYRTPGDLNAPFHYRQNFRARPQTGKT